MAEVLSQDVFKAGLVSQGTTTVPDAVGPTDALNKKTGDAAYAAKNHTHPSTTDFQWVFDSVNTMADPGAGDIRTDTNAGTPSTQCAISDITNLGIDATDTLRSLTIGDLIYFQQLDNANNWGRYSVSGAPVDNGTWWLFPISPVEQHGAPIAKAQTVLVRFTYGSGGGGGGGGGLDQATADGRYLQLTGGVVTGKTSVGPEIVGAAAATIFGTQTDDLTSNVVVNSFQVRGIAPPTANIQALQFNVDDTGANNTSTMNGINGIALKSGGGLASSITAIAGSARLSGTGSATNLISFLATMRHPAGTTATTATGFLVNPSVAGGTVTSSYGLKVAAMKGTGVTTGYGVASDGASDLNYFMGMVGIGKSAPTVPLDVVGNAVLTGTVTAAAPTASTHLTTRQYVDDGLALKQAAGSYQPLDADLTTIAGLTATTGNMILSVGSAWASQTPAQVKTALALNNVDNTSDANAPVSTAQQTALNLKANNATTVTATAPITGSGTLGANLTLGLATDGVLNTHLANMAATTLKGNSTGAAADPADLTVAQVKTMLALTKTDVGLANVDNTADTAKPVSTAQQTALNLKADITYVDARTPKITVASTAPSSPAVNDLWVNST